MATRFSIKDPNPGVWFKFNEDDADSGEICIRPVTMAKRQEIQKKTVKKKAEYKHGGRFEVSEVNDDLFAEMLWDYTIKTWERLEDDDGNPIDCTTANKVFLMQNNVGFASFVAKCMEKVNDDAEDIEAVVSKNSLTASPVSRKSRPAKDAGA
jgi:hypothetical protein